MWIVGSGWLHASDASLVALSLRAKIQGVPVVDRPWTRLVCSAHVRTWLASAREQGVEALEKTLAPAEHGVMLGLPRHALGSTAPQQQI